MSYTMMIDRGVQLSYVDGYGGGYQLRDRNTNTVRNFGRYSEDVRQLQAALSTYGLHVGEDTFDPSAILRARSERILHLPVDQRPAALWREQINTSIDVNSDGYGYSHSAIRSHLHGLGINADNTSVPGLRTFLQGESTAAASASAQADQIIGNIEKYLSGEWSDSHYYERSGNSRQVIRLQGVVNDARERAHELSAQSDPDSQAAAVAWTAVADRAAEYIDTHEYTFEAHEIHTYTPLRSQSQGLPVDELIVDGIHGAYAMGLQMAGGIEQELTAVTHIPGRLLEGAQTFISGARESASNWICGHLPSFN